MSTKPAEGVDIYTIIGVRPLRGSTPGSIFMDMYKSDVMKMVGQGSAEKGWKLSCMNARATAGNVLWQIRYPEYAQHYQLREEGSTSEAFGIEWNIADGFDNCVGTVYNVAEVCTSNGRHCACRRADQNQAHRGDVDGGSAFG